MKIPLNGLTKEAVVGLNDASECLDKLSVEDLLKKQIHASVRLKKVEATDLLPEHEVNRFRAYLKLVEDKIETRKQAARKTNWGE